MNIRRVLLVVIFGFGLGTANARAQYDYPFQNPNQLLDFWGGVVAVYLRP